jgi:hypothetical protein
MVSETIIKLTDIQAQFKIQKIISGVALGVAVGFPIGILAGVGTGSLYEYITFGKIDASKPEASDTAQSISSATLVTCTIIGGIVGGMIGNQNALSHPLKII